MKTKKICSVILALLLAVSFISIGSITLLGNIGWGVFFNGKKKKRF